MTRQAVVERCRTLMNELLEKSEIAIPAFPAQDRYSEENLRAQCGAMMRLEGLDQALGPHLVELCRLFSELKGAPCRAEEGRPPPPPTATRR